MMNELSLDPRISRLQLGAAGPVTVADGKAPVLKKFFTRKKGSPLSSRGSIYR